MIDFDDIFDEIENDVAKAGPEIAEEYLQRIKDDPQVPYETGDLEEGIKIVSEEQSKGRYEAVIESTTTNDGFDYPAFLDESSSHGHQGWWGDINDDELLNDVTDSVLSRYNL